MCHIWVWGYVQAYLETPKHVEFKFHTQYIQQTLSTRRIRLPHFVCQGVVGGVASLLLRRQTSLGPGLGAHRDREVSYLALLSLPITGS